MIGPPRGGAPATNIQGQMEFDDFGRLMKLISACTPDTALPGFPNVQLAEMVSHLVGLVGHVLARVQLLNAARRLTERHIGVASEGDFAPDVLLWFSC